MLSGWLNIDKPLNISSAEAVRVVKSLLKTRDKVGHAGTLDVLATGVLPIAVGEATKTIQFIQDKDKEYEFDLTFGVKTDTGDREGKIIKQIDKLPSQEEIEGALQSFLGEIQQTPPIYSALKINGKRAYELARSGETPEMTPRNITIYGLKLIDFDADKMVAKFWVRCSKGTYIRSLGVDIAESLGSAGYISSLKRTKVGSFLIKDTISLVKFKELVHNGVLEANLLSIFKALDDILAIDFSETNAQKILKGVPIKLSAAPENYSKEYAIARCGDKALAIGRLDDLCFKPIKVFNFN